MSRFYSILEDMGFMGRSRDKEDKPKIPKGAMRLVDISRVRALTAPKDSPITPILKAYAKVMDMNIANHMPEIKDAQKSYYKLDLFLDTVKLLKEAEKELCALGKCAEIVSITLKDDYPIILALHEDRDKPPLITIYLAPVVSND